MNEQQLAAVKLALVALEEWYFGCGAGSESHDDAVEAIKQAIAQDALDKKAENARELGLDYEPAPAQEPLPQCTHNWVSNPKEKWCLRCGAQEADHIAGGGKVMPTAAQPAVQEGRDWSLLEATQESLREHMAEIKRLKAAQPVKTYSGGKPWPVAPAPDPAPIIQQLVTALEGSGTRMRSDQWYVEIEAVAAGKFYLNSKGEGL